MREAEPEDATEHEHCREDRPDHDLAQREAANNADGGGSMPDICGRMRGWEEPQLNHGCDAVS